ncbi:MAG: Lrp/AsnC family transcriptional regulator [Nonomuraea sp.]|nr:Lrp/AsnC family transcriptional regulator [Nonomuraea sp.]
MKIDELDRRLVQALQVDGRASFSLLGQVLGISDQTVARRYRRLRSAGIVHVVGQADPRLTGQVRWYVRIRCRPDAALPIGEALARRPDTGWVQIVSGGTEIDFVVRIASARDRDLLLMQKLPRTPQVHDVVAHCLVHLYYGGATEHAKLFDALTADEIALLRGEPVVRRPMELDERDLALLDALGRDGRAGFGELAAATGSSESTVKRRLEQLRAAGAFYFDVDVAAETFGYGAQSRLWLSVPPSQEVAVGEALAGHEEVAFAAATTGPTNLVASLVTRDVYALHEYVTQRLGALAGVSGLETAPITRTLKGAGIIPPAVHA